METVNGVWYMKGCDPTDPGCLRSADALERLILEVGFLPLFSNEIPGFSVEEHTAADAWWTGDPETDPWEWRIQLASRPGLAYGKFFDRKAGYLSADWFPDFANYRRSGYDFDALWEDGLAPHRWKKLYDALHPDETGCGDVLYSNELKEAAGFGRGGEKNFEGVLTDLQMRTYLILGDFRQRVNRAGLPYGWHLSLVQTPETKWGYPAISAAYKRAPKASYDRITAQVLQGFPHAAVDALQKLIGRSPK